MISRRALAFLAGAFVVLASVVTLVPFAPAFPVNTLDGSWQLALDEAVARGLVFGRDIVFTFGPYVADDNHQYHPATDGRMLWSSALLALGLAAGLIGLARRGGWGAVALLALLLPQMPPDARLLGGPFVLLLLACRMALPRAHPAALPRDGVGAAILVLLAAAVSVLPLVKGTLGVSALLAVGLGGAALAWRGAWGMALTAVAGFAAELVGYWVWAGQPIGALGGYFLAILPIMGGYTEAMSSEGRASDPFLFLAGFAVLGLVHWRRLPGAGVAGLVLVAGLGLLLFLPFKAAFVRHDGHAILASGMLVLGSTVFAMGARGWRPWVAIAICCGLAWGIADRYAPYGGGRMVARERDAVVGAARGLAIRVGGGGAFRDAYARSLAAIRAGQALPVLRGTVDVYSYGQSVPIAYGLDWSPRFVAQTYSAYTPGLAAADAAHLVGAGAPDNILFAVQPIDQRLPALEDGPSWPALLGAYAPVALCGKLAVLRHKVGAVVTDPVASAPLVSGDFALGRPIALPEIAGPLWARIVVRPSLAGRVVSAVYKLPQLRIDLVLPGGVRRYRFIAAMGEAGFVVSPLVTDTRAFLDIAGLPAAQRPSAVTVSRADGPPWLWRRDVHAEFFAMAAPASADAVADTSCLKGQ